MEDLDDLFELSQVMNFINLPPFRDMIEEKIKSSEKSFIEPSKNLWENHYIFVLEDTEKKKVIGVSMIHSQHGTEDEPHFFFRVGKIRKFSETINTGFIHGTLKFGMDNNGPTEIGGLVLSPDYRNNPYKLGKQLSFVRFLYLATHPDRFKPVVHAELLPPFDQDGNSPLWEAIGRRFLNMDYPEADVLSRTNKEFILSLFPQEKIYTVLLPIDARDSIGKVGKETQPVKRMLEKIGFKYTNEVDPFDGGPHYRAKAKDITLVKKLIKAPLKVNEKLKEGDLAPYLISFDHPDHQFIAYMIQAKSSSPKSKNPTIEISSSTLKEIGATEGLICQCIPI